VRVALAILMGGAIVAVGFATLRSLARPGPHAPPPLESVKPLPQNVRVSYWCETCGADLLVVRQGSAVPPKHCGEPMQKREEILHES
jgi:hypothetical protein